jgi:hypothetical protein
METSPGLIRSLLKPSGRRTRLIAAAGVTGALVAGLTIGHVVTERSTTVLPIPTPITLEAPKVPAPVVNVNVPPPPVPPPPAPPPPAPPPPAPRALAPYLDSSCILAPSDNCTWDDGFPAVSADGALVVTKQLDGDPSGALSLEIAFLDAGTGRVVRRHVLHSLEEHRILSGFATQIAEGQAEIERLEKARSVLYGKVGQRIAAVQRMLDGRGFRSMQSLGSSQTGEEGTDKTRVYAQFQDNAARIIDPARNAVLWQHRLSVTDDTPVVSDGTEMCGGKSLRDAALWWDPATGIVLAQKRYVTGGCMCPSGFEDEVLRIPAATLPAPTAPVAPTAPAVPAAPAAPTVPVAPAAPAAP